MKTRLLFLLLFISSITFAQNWSQVGATQFTNFASDGAMAFDNSGVPYIVYVNPAASNKAYVKKFDGNTWIDFVIPEVSTTGAANVAIKIDPTTNQPVVAYRRTSNSFMDCYKFNGTSWVAVFTNVGTAGQALSNHRLQIQIDATSLIRVAGRTTDQSLTIVQRDNAGNGPNYYENLIQSNNQYNGDHRYDYNDFGKYYISYEDNHNYSEAGIKNIGAINNQWLNQVSVTGSTFKNVSGIAGEFYMAVFNDVYYSTQDEVRVYNTASNNIKTVLATNDIVQFRKSPTDDKLYLMYADNSTGDLMFENYNKIANLWSPIPNIGLNSNVANFFVKMAINPIDGNMYVLYLDGGKVSVKKYTIPAPINLPRIYVNINATGNNDGSSWANAFTNLIDATSNVGTNTTEIWVASGVYTPDISDRTRSFILFQDNITLYGGFDGTESSLSERDFLTNSTILSGDLNGDDVGQGSSTSNRSDNSYHVVTIHSNNVSLDGVQIINGHANGTSGNDTGSGVFIDPQAQNARIKNCEFNNNFGSAGGAIKAYYDINTSLTIENCIFNNNYSRYGSGLYFLVNNNRTVSLELNNCLFINNTSYDVSTTNKGYTGSAAWVRSNGSGSEVNTTITNCTFGNNNDIGTRSSCVKGPLALGRRTDGNSTHNATINNSILYGNTNATGVVPKSVNEGHTSLPNTTFVSNSIGEDNFSNLTYLSNTNNTNPLFSDIANDDYTLQTGSPAIDTGDNSLIPTGIIADLLQHNRIHNTTVDIGCYEYGSTAVVQTYNLTTSVIGSGTVNPSGTTTHVENNIVSVTATPAAGWQFDGWSGASTSVNPIINITMDADKNLVANFSQIQYELTIIENDGTVTPNIGTLNNGYYVYNAGTVVEITANPNTGYLFDHYEIIDSNGTLTNTTNPLSITMNDNMVVEAIFTPVCVVSFTDMNFKNALVSNVSINTNGDSEIQCSEASMFTGTIDVQSLNISSLDGIESFTAITGLIVFNNQINTVNLSANTALTRIIFKYNLLNGLDVTNNINLTRIDISNNPITSFNVTNQLSLIELTMSTTQISSIDLSYNTQLLYLEALNSNFSGFDLTQNPQLSTVYLGGSNATSLDLRNGNLSNIINVDTVDAPNITCIFVDSNDSSLFPNINNWALHSNNNLVETNAQCTVLAQEDFEISKISFYPNPTSNQITINSVQEIDQIMIYSSLGQKVMESINKTIDVSNLTNGIYLMNIRLENGSTQTKQFIKK